MIKALIPLATLLALALVQSTSGSLRKDLQTIGVLVNMSAPRPVQIDGLKASYAYTFTMTDANRKFPGQSTYSLVLGAADGARMSMFTLVYSGSHAEPAPSTFGQLVGHLARHCLGVSEEVIRAVANEFAQAMQASAQQGGKPQSLSKTYGPVVLVGRNLEFGPKLLKYTFYLTNTAPAGSTGRKTTCAVKT